MIIELVQRVLLVAAEPLDLALNQRDQPGPVRGLRHASKSVAERRVNAQHVKGQAALGVVPGVADVERIAQVFPLIDHPLGALTGLSEPGRDALGVLGQTSGEFGGLLGPVHVPEPLGASDRISDVLEGHLLATVKLNRGERHPCDQPFRVGSAGLEMVGDLLAADLRGGLHLGGQDHLGAGAVLEGIAARGELALLGFRPAAALPGRGLVVRFNRARGCHRHRETIQINNVGEHRCGLNSRREFMMRRVPRLAALASQQKPGSGVMLSSWVIGVDWRGYSPFPDKKRCTHEDEWDERTGVGGRGRTAPAWAGTDRGLTLSSDVGIEGDGIGSGAIGTSGQVGGMVAGLPESTSTLESSTPSHGDDAVRRRLDADRRDLLDLSLRNPLLNDRPRALSLDLQIVTGTDGGSAGSLFPLLTNGGARLSIAAALADSAGSNAETFEHAVRTGLAAEALTDRLLSIQQAARSSQEELGLNTLFLVAGVLRWFDSDDVGRSRPLLAPLLLLPALIERSGPRGRFRLAAGAEEPEINLSLAAKLRESFGIELPEAPDLDASAPGANPAECYFDAVTHAVRSEPGWQVDRQALRLGFYSFEKFLMYHDLDPSSWPAESPPWMHPILRCAAPRGVRAGGWPRAEQRRRS